MADHQPGPMDSTATARRVDNDRDPHNLVGRTIGGDRYEVERVIGLGGMGVVYRGRQQAIDREVAIKVLMPEMVEDKSLIKRFHLEARAASRLTHPNTITIHDFGREGNLLYIVMEYLRGESLQQVLKRNGNLSIERTCHVLSQACASLTEAHNKAIIHRDIKPDNIFLKTVGKQTDFVKVLDFGVAKLRDPGIMDATVTQAGMIFGTPKYMSPEQAKAKKLDGRTDIYALGVVAYECLMGGVPFIAEDPVSILIQHVHDPPPKFAERRPDLSIPEQLEAIVFRALEKNRQERYPSADLMREAVENFMEAYRAGAVVSGSYPSNAPLPTVAHRPPSQPPPTGPTSYPPPAYSATPPPNTHHGPPQNPSPAPALAAQAPPTMLSPPPLAATPAPVSTPAPAPAAPPAAVAAHAAETIVREMPRRRRSADFREFSPASEEEWTGELNLVGSQGTQMVRIDTRNRGLLLTVLALGILLLGGVGLLIFQLTSDRNAERTGPSTASNVDPTTVGGGASQRGIASQQGSDGVNTTSPNGRTADGAQTTPGGQVDPENPGTTLAAAEPLRVRFSMRPSDADLDFHDRRFERDPQDDDVYLFRPDDGGTLEFRASADGYRTRDFSEDLEDTNDDGLIEISVRLRRERSDSNGSRHSDDRCVDPRTGLRDPYCRR